MVTKIFHEIELFEGALGDAKTEDAAINIANDEINHLTTLYSWLPGFFKSDNAEFIQSAIKAASTRKRFEMLWSIVDCSGGGEEEPKESKKYVFVYPSITDDSYYIRRVRFNQMFDALGKLAINVENILDEYRKYVRKNNGTTPKMDEMASVDEWLLNLSQSQFFECVRMTIGIGREGTEETNPFVIVRKNTKKN
jgi:hypothetical protein